MAKHKNRDVSLCTLTCCSAFFLLEAVAGEDEKFRCCMVTLTEHSNSGGSTPSFCVVV